MCLTAVKAVTSFPSENTVYDNSVTGMSSTKVQSAIDELYSVCISTAGNSILEEVDIVTSGDGLYKDEYEDRYFYKGANPNNYIIFNNETWRIISIEGDGTIKIMRNESIGNIAWDSSNSINWDKPASLNTYLNDTYYNTLTETAKKQISTHNFSIGGIDTRNNLTEQINAENSKKWKGNIGLMTISEYIRINSNLEKCGTYDLYYNNSAFNKTCKPTSWMDIKQENDWWTLTSSITMSDYVYCGPIQGAFYDTLPKSGNEVFPVVYLSSEVKITSGDGSSNNPYRLE